MAQPVASAGRRGGLVTVIVRVYRMWWQRRPTWGSHWAVGRPPLRSGIRRQHPAVIAVVVGAFLPLFGLSLVGFLVVDAVVAAVKSNRARPDART